MNQISRILIIIIFTLMSSIAMTQDETLDRTKPPKPGPQKDVQFPEYLDSTLPNGINLLVIENYKIPVVSVRLVFKNAGSYFDGDNYGIASLTGELLTKGTKNRRATQIAEEIDFLGGSISAGSDWDGSYVSLSVLKKHFDKAIDVLTDVVLNPVFDPEELNRIREQRISTIIQGKDDPGTLSDRMFNKVVFENTPYANPSEGTEQSVRQIKREDIVKFYDTHYLPSNLILAFVGAISREEALAIVRDKFGAWGKKGNDSHNISGLNRDNDNVSYFSSSKVYIVDKTDAVQSSVRIGHVGIRRNNPDFLAVSVMNTILGGYFGSRINLNLREKHGFTYGARSSFNARILPGDFSVDTDVRNEVTDAAVKLIIEELKRIISEQVTDEELQTVKNYLTGIFPLQLETANAVATRVINLKLYDLPGNYYSTYISNINRLTKEDILNSAKKYINPDNLYIVISGNSEVISEKMENLRPVEVYNADGQLEKNN